MSESGNTRIDLSDAAWFETGAATLAALVSEPPTGITLAAEGAAAPEVPEAQFIAAIHGFADKNSIDIAVTGASEDFLESLRRFGLDDLCDRLEG